MVSKFIDLRSSSSLTGNVRTCVTFIWRRILGCFILLVRAGGVAQEYKSDRRNRCHRAYSNVQALLYLGHIAVSCQRGPYRPLHPKFLSPLIALLPFVFIDLPVVRNHANHYQTKSGSTIRTTIKAPGPDSFFYWEATGAKDRCGREDRDSYASGRPAHSPTREDRYS